MAESRSPRQTPRGASEAIHPEAPRRPAARLCERSGAIQPRHAFRGAAALGRLAVLAMTGRQAAPGHPPPRHPFALRGWRDGFSVPSVFWGRPAIPAPGPRRPGAQEPRSVHDDNTRPPERLGARPAARRRAAADRAGRPAEGIDPVLDYEPADSLEGNFLSAYIAGAVPGYGGGGDLLPRGGQGRPAQRRAGRARLHLAARRRRPAGRVPHGREADRPRSHQRAGQPDPRGAPDQGRPVGRRPPELLPQRPRARRRISPRRCSPPGPMPGQATARRRWRPSTSSGASATTTPSATTMPA